jgi:hypothetical protein
MEMGNDDNNWNSMDNAPRDGTTVELLIRHFNWEYSNQSEQWEQIVEGKWIKHNRGGWTWKGMCGTPHAWRKGEKDYKGGKVVYLKEREIGIRCNNIDCPYYDYSYDQSCSAENQTGDPGTAFCEQYLPKEKSKG